ncbi:hypothetical protein PT974_07989 [Cladobotryum mycophilum]|uniref:AAA+ ATPase domain-containing protein n=1 Tax=Cladobotryum mycophilum TaxID=491253 RepID=A0ABR0SD66_9HYPO
MASTPPPDCQTTPPNGLATPSTTSDRAPEPEAPTKKADDSEGDGDPECSMEKGAVMNGEKKKKKTKKKKNTVSIGDISEQDDCEQRDDGEALPSKRRDNEDEDSDSADETSDPQPGDELSELRQKLAEVTKQMEFFAGQQKKAKAKVANTLPAPFITPKRDKYVWAPKNEKIERLGIEFVSDASSDIWVSDDEYLEQRVMSRRRQASKIFKNEIRILEEEEKTITGIHEERKKWKERERELVRELELLKYELQEIKGPAIPDPGESQDVASETEKKDPLVQLNRIRWDVFKGVMMSHNTRFQYYAIDILIGDPDISYASMQKLWWMRQSSRNSKPQPKPPIKAANAVPNKDAIPGQGPVAERIRINSTYILKILEKIHGSSLYDYANSVIILRPFRALVYYRDQIQQTFNELEERFGPNAEPEGTILQDPEATEASPQGDTNNESKDAPQVEAGEGGETEQENEWTSSAVAYEQMKSLMEFMHTDIQTKLDYINSDQCQKATFNDLWYLFKPGDEVVERSMTQAYRVVQVRGATHRAVPPGWTFNASADLEEEPITIRCVFIDFDGKSLGPVMMDFVIKRFDGEKLITSLDVYPLRCVKDDVGIKTDSGMRGRPTLRERLIKRGEMFLSVTKVRHMHYNGYTLESRDEVDSQVVVDFEEALSKPENDWTPTFSPLIGTAEDDNTDSQECSEACCRGESIHKDNYVEKKWKDDYIASLIPQDKATDPSASIYPRDISDIKISDRSIPEEDLLIMSYRVFGYVLRSRKWGKLEKKAANEAAEKEEQQPPAQVQIKKRDTAFDRLVLPKGHKEMVLSLIAQHFRDKESSTAQTEQVDLVRGKGKGLIILLHGAPGVGKTTTAEGVAELFKKPLFQITCGDLGTTANDVEKALETHFALANKWGCILLLDEADVFLAARTPQDFIRNGMVAVFLRVLEYYAGILFLTTNRIGDFDEAFSSRIHISLHYPQLDLDSTEKIFQLNLDMIRKRFAEKRREIEISEAEIVDYAITYWKTHKTMRWNGRQIRNACHTALALAEFDAQGGDHEKIIDKHAEVKLELKHLLTVGSAYLEFMKYLGDVYGRDADKLAKQRRLRASEWNLAENVGIEKSPLRTEPVKEQGFPGSPPMTQQMPPSTSQEGHPPGWHHGSPMQQPPHLQNAHSMAQPPPGATSLAPAPQYVLYQQPFPQHPSVAAQYGAWGNAQGSHPHGAIPQGAVPHGTAPSLGPGQAPGPSGYVQAHHAYGQVHSMQATQDKPPGHY